MLKRPYVVGHLAWTDRAGCAALERSEGVSYAWCGTREGLEGFRGRYQRRLVTFWVIEEGLDRIVHRPVRYALL